MPITCDSCKDYGLSFYSTKGILPINYIEGRSDSKIWIVGLNPSGELHSSNNQENRTLEEFENFHPDDKNKKHKYFHDFKKVSLPLYKNYQSKEMSIVAHTDLVKCFSKTFPPFFGKKENRNKAISAIIKNCYEHLEKQIRIHQPQMIICNGSPVVKEMMKIFPPDLNTPQDATSYKAGLKGNSSDYKCWIVLSGFIGRIDDKNKRRLGKEIEQLLKAENIEFKN